MNLPGGWLLALAPHVLDPDLVESLVAPTVADLQHEMLEASGGRQRMLARARGYAALGRVILLHGLTGRSPMRRVAVIVALGCFGSVLLIGGARTATVGPGAIAGFFAMAVLAPVALRVLEGPTGFRVVFAQCCAIGFLMAAALFAWTWLAAGWPRPEWHIYAAATACLAVSVVFGSAVAAALASKATSGHGSLHRRRLRDVGLAAALFFSCYSLMGWSGGTDSRRLLGVLSWAGFLAFFFAAVSVVVYLPLLLGLRRALRMTRQDILLASAGAVLFPIPLLAFPLLQGRLHSTWLFLLEHPGALLPVSLPYVLAGGLLGWLLADRTALAGRVHLT